MKQVIRRLVQAVAVISIFQMSIAFSMDLAITVDDIPANGDLHSHDTRMDVAKKMLSVFKKHHISGVYGLINGSKLDEITNVFDILQEWIKEGQLLGNHAYQHLD